MLTFYLFKAALAVFWSFFSPYQNLHKRKINNRGRSNELLPFFFFFMPPQVSFEKEGAYNVLQWLSDLVKVQGQSAVLSKDHFA